ncbi:c-type cytochrome [Candidatus Entotheonella palauensis]|nr:c-type cytochrome [Candidatus Entotheonella palauensis]
MTRKWMNELNVTIGLLAGFFTLWCLFAPVVAESEEEPKKLNPYTGNEQAIQEGRKLFVTYGCSGCHGLGGGGGMGHPLTDDVWKHGSDDATLMSLIKGDLTGSTMPKFGQTLNDDQIWKLIAYVRSLYQGDPALIKW